MLVLVPSVRTRKPHFAEQAAPRSSRSAPVTAVIPRHSSTAAGSRAQASSPTRSQPVTSNDCKQQQLPASCSRWVGHQVRHGNGRQRRQRSQAERTNTHRRSALLTAADVTALHHARHKCVRQWSSASAAPQPMPSHPRSERCCKPGAPRARTCSAVRGAHAGSHVVMNCGRQLGGRQPSLSCCTHLEPCRREQAARVQRDAAEARTTAGG